MGPTCFGGNRIAHLPRYVTRTIFVRNFRLLSSSASRFVARLNTCCRPTTMVTNFNDTPELQGPHPRPQCPSNVQESRLFQFVGRTTETDSLHVMSEFIKVPIYSSLQCTILGWINHSKFGLDRGGCESDGRPLSLHHVHNVTTFVPLHFALLPQLRFHSLNIGCRTLRKVRDGSRSTFKYDQRRRRDA